MEFYGVCILFLENLTDTNKGADDEFDKFYKFDDFDDIGPETEKSRRGFREE